MPVARRPARAPLAPMPAPKQTRWNPVDLLPMDRRFRQETPEALVQDVSRKKWWTRFASPARQDEIYRRAGIVLSRVSPAQLGLERLLDGRLAAATNGEINFGARLPDPERLALVIDQISDLPFEGDPKEAWMHRRDARRHIAKRLSPYAKRLANAGNFDAALAVLRGIHRTGSMSRWDRAMYCRLLQREDAESTEAIRASVSYLEEVGWAAEDQLARELLDEVGRRLHIGDDTGDHEIGERLRLILRALGGGASQSDLPLSAGLAYLRLSDPARALPYLHLAVSRNGHDTGERNYHLAQALYQTGDFDGAATNFEDAAKRGFPVTRIAAWQGLSLAKSGKWDAAYQKFREAEQALGPEVDAEFFLYWGRASFLTGALDESEARFGHAIRLAESAAARLAKADLDTAAKKKALNASRRDRLRAVHGLATTQTNSGRTMEAIETLNRCAEALPHFAPAAHLMGRLQLMTGNSAAAIPHFRAAVALAPKDPVYLASLGFALDDAGDPAGISHLERAVDGKEGGAEAVRRITFAWFDRGDRAKAAAWLGVLSALMPGHPVCVAWLARDMASRATIEFNRRNYSAAVGLWERVAETLRGELLNDRLALALLCDAAGRLRAGAGDAKALWMQVERAHQLSPTAESAVLYGFCQIMAGRFEEARRNFEVLEAAGDHRPELRFLAVLAAHLGGDDGAAAELAKFDTLPGLKDLEALLKFLQIQVAVQRGDFKLAAQNVEAWGNLPNCLQAAGGESGRLNQLVLGILERAHSRRHKVIRQLEDMNSRHNGAWLPALVMARHHDSTPKLLSEAQPKKLAECDDAYHEARQKCPASGGLLRAGHGQLLLYSACAAVARGDLAGAQALFSRLDADGVELAPEAERLRQLVHQRLTTPSHQTARALLYTDQAAAVAIWEQLLEANPGDLVALHHIACAHWSRGYDLAAAAEALDANKEKKKALDKYIEAIQALSAGLEKYRALYSVPAFWDDLRVKGKAVATNKFRFDEGEFDTWREGALRDRGAVLTQLALYVAKEYEEAARKALSVLRASSIGETDIEMLADDFASRLLDPDPENLANFEKSIGEAERVLRIDPQNLKAQIFIVRACAFRVEDRFNQGETPWPAVADRQVAAASRARDLGKRVESIQDKLTRERIIRHLAAFWEALGVAEGRAVNELVGKYNDTSDRSHLRKALSGATEGISAFDTGALWDPTMPAKPRVISAREYLERIGRDIRQALY